MTKTFLPYYWIMALACIIPLVLLLVMPNWMDKEAFYFALLSFAPVAFVAGTLLINWKRGDGSTPSEGER
ncbi:MAG: hypothetical protein GTO24_15495 [candidate division Zixibacteria bacterium]|nr:hypothetical protein [candidate division Zixibacteria bacterium]